MASVVKLLIIVCLLLVSHLNKGWGHKILMYPINMNSHFLYFGRMGQGLAKLGHTVEMLVPSNGKIPWELATTDFKITPYKVDDKKSLLNSRETSEMYLRYALSKYKFFEHFKLGRFWFGTYRDSLSKDCENLLDDRELMKKLLNESNFEFIISDFLMTDCQWIFVKAFKIPYGLFIVPFTAWNIGIPRLPSFEHSKTLYFGNRMNFIQRTLTFLTDLSNVVLLDLVQKDVNIPDYLTTALESYNFWDTLRNASLYFFLEDVTVGHPSTLAPDVISVGDISGIGKVGDLPSNIKDFLSKSTAVYISFGSFFQYPTEELIQKFCRTFEILREVKIIWKLNNATVCGTSSSNLLVLPWVPQNDLLADKRIKLFVTHGGFNSLIESIYHATPVIVFPLAADQPMHAQIAEDKGYGKYVDLRYWNPDSLASTIKEMLDNQSYTERAKHYSNILRSRHDTPAERVSIALSNVLRFGSEHMRSSARDLHWFQLMMFDIAAVLFSIITIILLLLFFCFYRMLKYIIRKVNSPRKKIKSS